MKDTIRGIISDVITIFWLLDICNMPFMEIFDTEIPLNGMFWIMFFILFGDRA